MGLFGCVIVCVYDLFVSVGVFMFMFGLCAVVVACVGGCSCVSACLYNVFCLYVGSHGCLFKNLRACLVSSVVALCVFRMFVCLCVGVCVCFFVY